MSITCISCGHINGDGATVCANCQSSLASVSGQKETTIGEVNPMTANDGCVLPTV